MTEQCTFQMLRQWLLNRGVIDRDHALSVSCLEDALDRHEEECIFAVPEKTQREILELRAQIERAKTQLDAAMSASRHSSEAWGYICEARASFALPSTEEK